MDGSPAGGGMDAGLFRMQSKERYGKKWKSEAALSNPSAPEAAL